MSFAFEIDRGKGFAAIWIYNVIRASQNDIYSQTLKTPVIYRLYGEQKSV